ncbi:MAG: anti-sigma-L factor RslA [Mycobacteriales bacterium]
MNHDEAQRSLASYVLGALAPGERRDVDTHLAGCPACREELASYAGLPGLLSRLELSEAVGDSLLPPPSLLPSVLTAVEAARRDQHRQVSRWRIAAAGLTAAAALAGVLAVTGRPGTAPSPRQLVAAAGVSSRGSVSLQPRPWGTELHLRLRGLPPADGYAAYAVDRSGARTLAASWGPTPDGQAAVPAATRLPPKELSRVVVQTRAGQELLVLAT